jgi:transposase
LPTAASDGFTTMVSRRALLAGRRGVCSRGARRPAVIDAAPTAMPLIRGAGSKALQAALIRTGSFRAFRREDVSDGVTE